MIRKIIHIDEEKCNGCGLCARACHESAIGIIDGKAKLLREDYCDGLGDCLPACPTNAISFVEKEAAAYDEAAVLENKKKLEAHSQLQQWPVQIKLVPIHILTMLTFLLLQTAQPMLTLTSIRILSKVRLLLSAVRNWTL